MLKHITFILLFFFFCLKTKGQFLNYSIKGNMPVAVLPFEMYNDFIVISLVYENKLPLKFILDTGATNTLLIHKEYARMTGTKFERRIFIRGADRRQLVPALVTENVNLDLSKIIAKKQHILVLEENVIRLDKYAGVPIDGILGLDIFKKFIIRIDYISEKLIFYKPDFFKPNLDKYQVLDLNMHNHKLYLKSPIEIKKDSIVQGEWLLDTGAAMTIMIHGNEADSTFLPTNRIPGNIGKGLGGFISGYLSQINSFKIGDYPFENFRGNFQPLADSIFQARDSTVIEGLIGNKIFKNFHLIFDYHKQKLYYTPNNNYGKPIPKDRSGLGIIASGYLMNQFEVEEVYPNSPAERAGLQVGDRIKKINNASANILTLEGIERRFCNKRNKKIKLLVIRNDKKLKYNFYLDDYL